MTKQEDVGSDDAKTDVAEDNREQISRSNLAPVRMGLVLGLAFVVALVGLCGWLGYRAHQARAADQLRTVMVQVARQGAVNLTTIDYEHAESDVQRILDSTTGQFHDDFQARSAPFIDVVKKAKSKSVGTVTEAGVESIDGRTGKVLVAVTVKTVSDGNAEQQPRYWRMRVTVDGEGQVAKISNVDFVP